MATVWIQIFILSLTECVAPVGKTVCQQQQFELQFLTKADCEYALQQLITMKDESDYVIVDHQKSACVPAAAESQSFASLDDINQANKDTVGWRVAAENNVRRSAVKKDHSARLADLMSCEETSNVVPCKIGDIIVEAESGDNVEVWKQE